MKIIRLVRIGLALAVPAWLIVFAYRIIEVATGWDLMWVFK